MAEQDKDVEFYAAGVNAWFGTRLEHDKSLLTLSAGGIGLLITLLSTVGIHSAETVLLYVLALVSFLVCLSAVLWIFRRNATHLQDIIKSNAAGDPTLRMLDTVAIASFLLGVLLSSIIGVAAAIHSFQSTEPNMSNDQKSKGERILANDSFSGAVSMKPDPLTRSYNGAINLKPGTAAAPNQQPASTVATAQQQPASTAPATQQQNNNGAKK